MRRFALTTVMGVLLIGPARVSGQVSHCAAADRFLTTELQLATVTEPDTIDDWRTGQRQAGCRITAAGLTRSSIAEEATRFYDRVRAAGWVRTPDPRDSPGESSLRFRTGGTDCLFNIYSGVLLLTEAERTVSMKTIPDAGNARYGVFVLCMAAMPAKPR